MWLTCKIGSRNSFKDRKNKSIEDQLNDFIICLIETSDRNKRREAEQKRDAEERQRKRDNETARRGQAEQEQANRDKLEQLVNDWHKAQQLREFISAVEQSYQPIETASELAGWLVWANNHANRLDPLNRVKFQKQQKKTSKVVPRARLELARPFGPQILSLMCLPFHHRGMR